MRLPEKKCLIVFDTNCIYVADRDNSYEFSPTYNFTNFLNWVEAENVTSFCTLAIPKIVLLEIVKQKFDRNEQLKSDYEKASRFFNKQYDSIVYTFDDICAKVSEFFISHNIEIIDNPSQIEPIISRAVHKQKPFDYTDKKGNKKETGSDKGFKDAVLLHSVIEIENLILFREVFVCTNNHRDFIGCDSGECPNLKILSSKNALHELENVLKEHLNILTAFNWIENNKDTVLAHLNDYGGDWEFVNFTYDINNFEFKKNKNVVEFLILADAIGHFGGEGLTRPSWPICKWFDLSANDIIYPEDETKDIESKSEDKNND